MLSVEALNWQDLGIMNPELYLYRKAFGKG